MYTSYRPNNYSTACSRNTITVRSTRNPNQKMKVYYLMDYLPKRYDGTAEQIQDRQSIYDFKDGCCEERILNGLAGGIRRLADSNTVVCFVPASSAIKTIIRYSVVAERLQEMTKVKCSFFAIEKKEDGEAGHISGKSADPAADFVFSSSFFSGKKVILIDDVITRGTTLETTARRLKELGAKEVIGMVVGKTINPDWTGGENRNIEKL